MQFAVALAVQQRINLCWRFIPALLEGRLARMLGDNDGGGVQLAVADHLHFLDGRNFFTNKFENRAATVTRDAPIRLGACQLLAKEGLVEPLAT